MGPAACWLTDLISSLQTPDWSHTGENSLTSPSVQLRVTDRGNRGGNRSLGDDELWWKMQTSVMGGTKNKHILITWATIQLCCGTLHQDTHTNTTHAHVHHLQPVVVGVALNSGQLCSLHFKGHQQSTPWCESTPRLLAAFCCSVGVATSRKTGAETHNFLLHLQTHGQWKPEVMKQSHLWCSNG